MKRTANLMALLVCTASLLALGCGGKAESTAQKPVEGEPLKLEPIKADNKRAESKDAVQPDDVANSDTFPVADTQETPRIPESAAQPETSAPDTPMEESVDSNVKREEITPGAVGAAEGFGNNPVTGIITEPVAALSRTRVNLSSIEIKHFMKHDPLLNGEYKDTDDLLKRLKAAGLSLPDLQPNQRFFYDKASNELMVETVTE